MNEIEKSTRVLREEHQLIENALIAMADIIKRLEKDNTLDRHQLCEMAHAFATFVGRSHHTKEDFLLSMIRARRGCSDEYAVRTFYQEHHCVEVLLARLRKTADEYLDTADQSTEPLVGSLRDVVVFIQGTCGRPITSCSHLRMISCLKRIREYSSSSSVGSSLPSAGMLTKNCAPLLRNLFPNRKPHNEVHRTGAVLRGFLCLEKGGTTC
jgi:hypothetical protein